MRVRPSHLFFLGLFVALTVPRMAQPGMFIDGVTYAVLARNLAAAHGTFWSPFYTATVYPRFHEQPPLGFAIEAVAFAMAGDHLAVERAFSVLIGLSTMAMVVALWRLTFADRDREWLPLLFWLLPSTVTWAIVNNMLENIQAALTTGAVLAFVGAWRATALGALWASLGGGLIAAAVLVKGPTGLFPIVAPIVALAAVGPGTTDARRRPIWILSAMTAALVAIAAVIATVPAAREALANYWSQHLGAAMSGARGGSRVAALGALARHLAGGIFLRMGAMLGLIAGAATVIRTPAETVGYHGRWTWFFLGMGLAASVPVLASTKISGHYIVPSIPLFALGFAGLARPWAAALQRRFAGRRSAIALIAIGAALLVAAVMLPLTSIPIEPRDVRWIAEYRAVGPAIPRGATVGTCSAAAEDWGLHAYMQRLFEISLDANSDRYPFYLLLKDRACTAPPRCRPAVSTERLTVLSCSAN